ncbi:MAG: hypothetical protein KGD73_03965 [Candidatus Lokiarchaeota archaeon]|nr:hypothetical protein [Candidatus Lokiarchaeota archaeon]
MDSEDFWNNFKWTLKARKILKGIEDFPEGSKIILLLRHSHRNEPLNLGDLSKEKLTEIGHNAAKRFGEELPIDRSIRLFHSVVWRCQETAEDILEGFRRKTGLGKMKGTLQPLYFIGTAPNFFVNIFKKMTPLRFMNLWIAGHYSPETIIPFQSYCKNAADIIWNKIKSAPEKGIDIHVSHDILLIALRYGWFGIPPRKKWIPFLGGFALILHNDKIRVFNDNEFIEMDPPYWWKNKNKSSI